MDVFEALYGHCVTSVQIELPWLRAGNALVSYYMGSAGIPG